MLAAVALLGLGCGDDPAPKPKPRTKKIQTPVQRATEAAAAGERALQRGMTADDKRLLEEANAVRAAEAAKTAPDASVPN